MGFMLMRNRLVQVNVILVMNQVRPKINASFVNTAPSTPKKVETVINVQNTACQMNREPSVYFMTP